MELEGKWLVTWVVSCGAILSEDEGITVVWEFRIRHLEITRTGPGVRRGRSLIYPIASDPTKQPKELDATTPMNQQLGFTGIYEFDGDTLTICWNPGVFRPQEFESSPSNGFTITTLKRLPAQREEDRVMVTLPRG
jgi:uncharacterized protein (TIGR03067 family)